MSANPTANRARAAGAVAMPQGGQLTLTSRPGGDGMVEIDVADTGVGIPPEQLGLYSTKARRLGLGLALVRATVGSQASPATEVPSPFV